MAKATWDTVDKGVGVVLSNGNLTAVVPDGNTVRASLAKITGKWYWEIKVNAVGFINIGIVNSLASLTTANYNTQNARYYRATQRKLPDNVQYGSTYTTNDAVGVAMDLDGGTLTFYKNGVSQGISHTNIKTMGEVYPAVTNHSTTANTSTVNFGETPFSHPIPEGFQAYQPPAINKSFILLENQYKNRVDGNWNDVSSTLPTLTQFQNEGIDDLSTLNRKVQLVDDNPQIMINNGVLGAGKVFKGVVDLSKYFDLRKLEVK